VFYKLHERDKVLERMGGNKGISQKWSSNTTSERERTY